MTNQALLKTQPRLQDLSSAPVPDDGIEIFARTVTMGEMNLLQRWMNDTYVTVQKNFCELFIEHGMLNNPAVLWLWKHGIQVIVEE